VTQAERIEHVRLARWRRRQEDVQPVEVDDVGLSADRDDQRYEESRESGWGDEP
jgi:hypothetical protein